MTDFEEWRSKNGKKQKPNERDGVVIPLEANQEPAEGRFALFVASPQR